MKRLVEIDGLRGLAILAIMLFHYFYWYDVKFGHHFQLAVNFSWGGNFGNYLFIIISGYVGMISLVKTVKPLDFIVRRLSKLFPAYWAGVILTFTVVSIFSLPGREVRFKDFLLNFSMLQHWLGVPDVDGAYWILPIFLVFYGFMFLIRLTKQVNKIEVLGVGLVFIEMALRLTNFPAKEIIQYWFGFFDYAHLFLCGILFYQLHTKGWGWRRGLLIMGCFLVELTKRQPIETISLLVILIIFSLVLNIKNSIFTWRPLVWLGEISYPLFLIHTNIGYVVIQQLSAAAAPNYLILSLPFLITGALAAIIHYATNQ